MKVYVVVWKGTMLVFSSLEHAENAVCDIDGETYSIYELLVDDPNSDLTCNWGGFFD